MERERIGNSLPPPQNPAEKAKLLLAENNTRILAIQQGKDLATDILNQIDMAHKLLEHFGPSFGPLLIRSTYNPLGVTVPSDSNLEQWKKTLEADFNPISPEEVSDEYSSWRLREKHTRQMVLITLGFTPTTDESSSTFNIPWKAASHNKNSDPPYFYARTSDKNVFLVLTPKIVDKDTNETVLVEDIVVVPYKKALRKALLNRNTALNGSRDMVGLEPVAA